MKETNTESVSHYNIKVGNAYLESIKTGLALDMVTYELRNIVFTVNKNKARKWYFEDIDGLCTVEQSYEIDDFKKTLKLLEKNGMSYEVLKTTTTTAIETKTVPLGNKKKASEVSYDDIGSMINNISINTQESAVDIGEIMKNFQKVIESAFKELK